MTSFVGFLSQWVGSPILKKLGIAKIISIFLRLFFAFQVSPGARIGRNVKLAYAGLGIIIHGDCIVGNDVSIGAHVVLGGNLGKGGVPIIGDRAFIGPGAKILGPIQIGEDATVGANAVVTKSVPAGTVVVGIPARAVGG